MRPDVHREAMLLLGLLSGIAQVAHILPPPVDALAYWQAGTSTELYPEKWSEVRSGLLFYPPPVAQVSTLLQPIGWPTFDILWTTLIFLCFWYCARRWSLPLVAVGLLPIVGVPVPVVGTFLGYALLGNMQWILAALVVVAIRHPAAWAVQLVTKTGPAVGGLWHLARGEWRAVGMAALTSLAVVAVSFAFAPRMWVNWAGFVTRNYTFPDPPLLLFPIPFGLRIVTAAILVVWGARTDRPWTVAIAAGWALPVIYGWGFLPFWVGGLRMARPGTEVPVPGARPRRETQAICPPDPPQRRKTAPAAQGRSR